MTLRASFSADWPQNLTAACERLLHPSVTDVEERARQCRLLQVLLLAPLMSAITTAQILAGQGGDAATLAGVCTVFGIGLLAPFALMATAKRRIIEAVALACASILTGLLIAAGGGLASPLAVLATALTFEAGWVGRSRGAVLIGVAAAAIATASSVAFGALVPPGVEMTPSAFQWIVPLIYVATILVRVLLGEGQREQEATRPGAAFEEILGAVILRMQVSGDVVDASERSETLLGVAPEMLLGTGLFDRVHVADRVAYLSALGDVREGAEQRSIHLRLRVPTEPGNSLGAIYRNFICDMARKPPAEELVVMLRDDGVNAELEETLALAREAADGAVLARDQLLASVSHELRTPLNAIVGFSDVLANEMFGSFANEKQREYVGLIREAGEHLLSVVNSLLDLSKLQSGAYVLHTEPFQFEDAVRLCQAMTAHQVRAKCLEMKMEIAKDVGTVNCDRRAVQQVLVNLLSNAVKFTPSGEVKVTAQRNGDRLDFTVSDTGIGISADDLQRVGQPFTQVQNDYTRQYDGMGLGLALVKGLVRLQGGGMTIESAPGAGTRVHVSLPADGAGKGRAFDEPDALRNGANWNSEWKHDALRKTA